MRLLIYGFEPYKHYSENITERIIRQLPRRRGLKTIVFPVRFHEGQFVEALRRYKPDVILGLGQCARGNRLRLEALAVNERRDHRRAKKKSIVPGGPPRLATSFKITPGLKARVSRFAGSYVCNFSMYVILHELGRSQLPSRFGFIHIPCDYSRTTAVRFILKIVQGLGH